MAAAAAYCTRERAMAASTKNIARLIQIMARLRGPRGCPWDREQTHRSLRQYLIEECYEVCDAIDAGDKDALREELGDLLLQVVFHAQVAKEAGRFDFEAVARVIGDKLVRRHPHVFGRGKLRTSAEVLTQWEAIKKTEKSGKRTAGLRGGPSTPSILHELPQALPALLKADKVQRKVARVGFDWKDVSDVVRKVEEELGEVRGAMAAGDRRQFEEELGDLLFAAVNLARFEGLQAEDLLNRTIRKFVARFQQVERAVHASGRRLEDCRLEELDALWESAKRKSKRRR
jgi:tetrapyrrole methylase family protein / MazG family protein